MQHHLRCRARRDVAAAHDVGHAGVGVVDDDRELIRDRAVAPPHDRIAHLVRGGLAEIQPAEIHRRDPIVRRKDGAIAYQLAVVVDDADAGITDVIRGRDIAPPTATQVMLQRLLGLPTPRYRHHFLLLESSRPGARKLAKLHGSIPFSQVRGRYSAEELTGWLAHVAGLEDSVVATTPQALVERFDWMKVPRADRIVHFEPDRGLY